MTTYDFEIVPQVALDARFDGKLNIYTFRTNDRGIINSLMTKLQDDFATMPDKGRVFWLFDFGSRNKPAPTYLKLRLQALAEATALSNYGGRIAVTTTRNFNTLLNPSVALAGLEAELPNIMLQGFFNRDEAIAWLLAGYGRATLRSQ